MRDGRHALGEGPCGTGKSLAHAVPAVWHAHHHQKRVVIVTANIALQEQLVEKDLPLLKEVLPWPFTFALLKGRGQFLCLDRMAERRTTDTLLGGDVAELQGQLEQLAVWAANTQTGDISELSFVPVSAAWSRFSVGSDDCKGEACAYREQCFSERARAAASSADLIVTNYHLLFAHLAVRRMTGAELVLPPFDLLVLDEAHEAPDIARDFFGFSVSVHTVTRLARFAEERSEVQLAGDLRRHAVVYFDALTRYARSPTYKTRLTSPAFADPSPLLSALGALATLANEAAEDERIVRTNRAKARNVHRHAATAAMRLREASSLADANVVYSIALDSAERAKLVAKPIDVAPLLRGELFDRTPSVTLLSATMTTAGTFDFIRRELGVPPGTLEVVAESPFDFRRQALLVIPEGLPDPRKPEFAVAMADAVAAVVAACEGRTLALFTSYRNLNIVYERLAAGPHRVFKQGDLPRTELTRLFKEDVSSVLLGTESFWTGIDVPGPALTGLVIDKLPFPNLDDPVVDAICARDPNAFEHYLIPRAIILLRQGVGRLIRSQQDVGVVVILDRRLAEKPYGRRFVRSLPPMLSTRKLANVSRFLAEAAATRSG